MTKIYPVILAGGSGTRLWPLSRKSFPKQFANVLGSKTLFQETLSRVRFENTNIKYSGHIVLTNSDFRFIVKEQAEELGINLAAILIEPEVKSTAPAILTACLHIIRDDPDGIMLVVPSDHLIPNKIKFNEVIAAGIKHVEAGKMVTFGIKPSRPETGYGYLELSGKHLDEYGTSIVSQFVEKPQMNKALEMIQEDNFLWNAGIFLFKASDMISAFKLHQPSSVHLVTQALTNAKEDLGFIRLEEESWSKLANISVDFAVMEKADNLVAVPFSSEWSDLGDWAAVWSAASKDLANNVVSPSAHAIDCSNTFLRSQTEHQKLIGLGLEDTIAIAMPDAVLVTKKERAQDVKNVVEFLRAENITQADIFPKDHRPWGWFESLALGPEFQVKRIFVKPNAALSLQSHRHRSEHWIVVRGQAKVTIDHEVTLLSKGQSVYVPVGVIHRIENPGRNPLDMIEIQIGSYLSEDDIIRYEDMYKRN